MTAVRRYLACLLMLLLPLSAWAGQTHCFSIGTAVPAMTALHTAHALPEADEPASHQVSVMASESPDDAHAAHHHSTPHKDKAAAGADHGAPCCGAVLPAPTSQTTASATAPARFPELGARFDSLSPTPLKRPPRFRVV